MVPSVCINGVSGSLLILVISQHHVCSTCKNLAWNILWVVAVYPHLHVYDRSSTASLLEGGVVGIADDRCTLCCSVAYGIWEAYAFEEALHLLVECCSADDYLVELSSECCPYLLAYLLVHLLVDDGHIQ